MTMSFSKGTTPKGHDYLRMLSSGEVTAADAENMNKTIAPGQPLSDMPVLGLIEPGTTYAPEARQAFTKSGDGKQPVAIVVTSAPLRVLLTFVVRMGSSSGITKFFSNETDALAWIDEKIAKAGT